MNNGGAMKTCCEICPECKGHMHYCADDNKKGCRRPYMNVAPKGQPERLECGPHGAPREESFWWCVFCDVKVPIEKGA